MSIDWNNGTWCRHGESSAPPDARITVTGDWAAVNRYEHIMRDDPAGIYGDLLPVLADADLRIVNLETVLSHAGTPIPKDGPNMHGHSDCVAALAAVPFNVACLANNHIMDYGVEALDETLDALRANAIRTLGAGLSPGEAYRPLTVDLDGVRVGIVNFCEGEDGTTAIDGPGVFGWEIDMVGETVRELRDMVDVLIVIAHAGREYAPVPPPYIQHAFRAISRAGVDIVVGHHPHVPQGVEVFEGVPIVYSLGNFVFWQEPASAFQRKGYVLTIEVTNRQITGFRLVPYVLRTEGVRLPDDCERARLLQQLRDVSAVLDDPARTRAVWEALIDSFGENFWRCEYAGLAPLIAAAENDPDHAAAALRNRFQTPAHHHLMADGLGRMLAGRLGTAEAWAVRLVSLWTDTTDA